LTFANIKILDLKTASPVLYKIGKEPVVEIERDAFCKKRFLFSNHPRSVQ
jgi:hypothetical protein